MDKIVIIGAGFAGLSAAKKLKKLGLHRHVSVIDKRRTSDFLPMLPDCIGRQIPPALLSYDIEDASRRLGFNFVNDEATAIDLQTKAVRTSRGNYSYDHLVISCGAKTNFFANTPFEEQAFGLVSSSDARRLLKNIREKSPDNYMISGGGYTGIEAATNVKLYLDKHKINSRVFIVEKAPRIMGGLPEWIRVYTECNLRRMGISVITESSIDRIEGTTVVLAGEKRFENTLVIWAVGVNCPAVAASLDVPKNKQGRINVDEYLRFAQNCYAIGDSGFFCVKENCLRMAVQFSIAQGAIAAENIYRAIRGSKPVKFDPLDLGCIVPMANNRSCGIILGMRFKGLLPTFMHYLMCAYRIQGLRRKIGILKQLLFPVSDKEVAK